MSHFSFSLTHTLTVFLSISSHGLHLSKWLNISLCFCSLWNSHTLAEYGSLCFFFLLQHSTRPNGLFFLLFFFFIPHALQHFSIREVRACFLLHSIFFLPSTCQTCFSQVSLRGMVALNLKTFGTTLINELCLEGMWAANGLYSKGVTCTQHYNPFPKLLLKSK